MRRILSFPCEGQVLAGTLDDAPGATGLLIVSGGNEIRIGAHRGMAKLAADIAKAGFPVLRFDRRGIGDSDGENAGFLGSKSDIQAGIAAFREECPQIKRFIAFGNCDAATALVMHQLAEISALLLANIWVIEPTDDLPPAAAIKARYLERIRDPKAWIGLLTGSINLRKTVSGLLKISQTKPVSGLAARVAQGLAGFDGPVTILLANRDATALAFASEWESEVFASARSRDTIGLTRIDSASHSFASDADYQKLYDSVIELIVKDLDYSTI
jgi:exosortase A-associated hydrolase 1